MMHPQLCAALLIVATVAGCSEPAMTAPALNRTSPTGEPVADVPIPVYGLGRSGSGRPCWTPPFRGFDFWLGKWEVFDQTNGGVLAGWNHVTAAVDGCAIEEHWTDTRGGRGRSLNTYDIGTGQWHQQWIDASGGPLTLAGSAGRASMVMEGSGAPASRLTWTREDHRRVRQLWEISEDDRQTWSVVFDGEYRRRLRIEPATEVPAGFCDAASRPRFHWFDFLIGEWAVRRASEAGPDLGRLSVAKDLSGCLVESTFQSAHGYRGKAFAALDFRTRTWNRTWIDRDGVRIAVVGAQSGAGMVMTGIRHVRGGGAQTIRITWMPATADVVTEQWDVSLDGGVVWSPAGTFFLTRRA